MTKTLLQVTLLVSVGVLVELTVDLWHRLRKPQVEQVVHILNNNGATGPLKK